MVPKAEGATLTCEAANPSKHARGVFKPDPQMMLTRRAQIGARLAFFMKDYKVCKAVLIRQLRQQRGDLQVRVVRSGETVSHRKER